MNTMETNLYQFNKKNFNISGGGIIMILIVFILKNIPSLRLKHLILHSKL